MEEGLAALKLFEQGLLYDPEKEELTIDLNHPRVIKVKAVNKQTCEEKFYVLKVTRQSLCMF